MGIDTRTIIGANVRQKSCPSIRISILQLDVYLILMAMQKEY
jgi:hypothetical protein